MHRTVLVDRDILANDEAFVGEMIPGFVGQIEFTVIVKPPGASGVIDEMPKLVIFVWTLPRDTAGLAMGAP